MNNADNSHMNIVEVNLNNGDKSDPKTNINYQGLNILNTYKDNDNSGESLSNPQEEIEEEQEHEELSIAEIAHLRKIHEQTLLRSEKYANIYSPQNDKSPMSNIDSNEKINQNKEEENNNNTSPNTLEIFSENDNEHFNEQKINPNKDRIFKNIHCYFYLDNEPLIIIGPDLGYFIWIFTLVSFLSILIYSLKTSAYFTSMLYIMGYIIFAACYILLMILKM